MNLSEANTIITLSEIDHVVRRPEVYMTTGNETSKSMLIQDNNIIFVKTAKNLKLNHMYKEIVANAIDANPTGTVHITTSVESIDGANIIRFIVYNEGVPIRPTDLERCFFHFRTGSNFGESITGIGRNGLGAKIVPIISDYFKVSAYNLNNTASLEVYEYAKTQKIPKLNLVAEENRVTGTKVEWMCKLGVLAAGDDIRVYESIAIEFAMGNSISINFNGTLYSNIWTNLAKYLKFKHYYYSNENPNFQYYMIDIKECNEELNNLSVVNGLVSCRGGIHVNKFHRDLSTNIHNKFSNISIDTVATKMRFAFLYNIRDGNVKQEGQSKGFISHLSVEYPNVIVPNDVLQWPSMSTFSEELRKESLNRIKAIPLKDNTFYTPPSTRHHNILLIGEGDSTRGYLNVMRELYGVTTTGTFVLRGKPRNCIGIDVSKIEKNKVVIALMSALGINMKGEGVCKYNHIIIAADADEDGLHIVTLIWTIFVEFWPSLLKRLYMLGSYVGRTYLNGHIVGRYLKNSDIPTNDNSVKYFKGLGSCTREEIIDDYVHAPLYRLLITNDGIYQFRNVMLKTNRRAKQDVANNVGMDCMDGTLRTPQTIESHGDLHNMYCLWRYYYRTYILKSISRAIPNAIDGFKDSLRKVMFTVLTDKHEYFKVDVLANLTSQKCDYHHGATSLAAAILRLARPYHVQLPLLIGDGQFGTINGDDCAASRYLSVSVPPYLKKLFPFKYVDQTKVLSILPYPYINGMKGIATAGQTNIPQVDLAQLIANVYAYLNNESHKFCLSVPQTLHGKFIERNGNVVITEPPYGQTFSDIRTKLKKYNVDYVTIAEGHLQLNSSIDSQKLKQILTSYVGRNITFHVSVNNDIRLKKFNLNDYAKYHAKIVLDEYGIIDVEEKRIHAQAIEKAKQILTYCRQSNGMQFNNEAELRQHAANIGVSFSAIKSVNDLNKTVEGISELENNLNLLRAKVFRNPVQRYRDALDSFVACFPEIKQSVEELLPRISEIKIENETDEEESVYTDSDEYETCSSDSTDNSDA